MGGGPQRRQLLLLPLLLLLLGESLGLGLWSSRGTDSSKYHLGKWRVSAFFLGPPHSQPARPRPLQLSRLYAKKQQQQEQQQQHRSPKPTGLKDKASLKPSKETSECSVPRAAAGLGSATAHASPAATTPAAEKEPEGPQEDYQLLYNDPAVFWTPASLSPLQVPKEVLQQLSSSAATAAAPTAAAVTPWTSIAASRFVDAATDTFVPKASSEAAAAAAREAAWRAAQRGASEQRVAAAAAAAAQSFSAASEAAGADSSESSDELWGDLDAMLRRLLKEEEEAERAGPSFLKREPNGKQEGDETDADISIEPRFIPEDWTDVPRPFAAFWLNALGVAVRSMNSRAAAASAWLRKQHNLQRLKQYKSTWRLQQEQQADPGGSADAGTPGQTDAEAPPFPLPPSIININHRFYNAFKLMNTAGWKACLDLPTPHTRLESWRLGSELRHLYFSRFDSRVSLKRKLLPSHLKQYVLPHADAVLVMRDGVVDPSLSKGACFFASQLADQEEVGGVAASLLQGIETKNPHHHQHQASASAKGKCGCDDKATAEVPDTHAAAAAAAADEPERAEADEDEGLEAVCCSFFDLQDAAVRAAIEKELRFIPEYTNYHRKNTQPFHRGQIGKTSRKYDNDYSIYDYRKLDFGMAKFSALNLAGMHDAGVLIVADCQKSSDGVEVEAAGAGDKNSQPASTDAVDGPPEGQKNAVARKPLVLQIIHVATTDELDAIGNSNKSSSDSSKETPPATPLINPRVVIHVGRHAKCQVHQTHVSFSSLLSPAEQSQLNAIRGRRKDAHAHQPRANGFKGPFVNSATRVVVEEGGELHHVYAQVGNKLSHDVSVQDFGAFVKPQARAPEGIDCVFQPGASYKLSFVDLGAALSRFALQVEGAEGSSHVSRGISLLHGKQDHSKYEMLHHLAKDAETDQVHKSLVGGNARSIWKGRIRIEREATGASASSLNRVILLEDGARCVAVPTLEIIPEEIKKATHGAAIRDFDTEPLFYMMSRGLPVLEAKKLLMLAFVDDVVSPLKDEGLARRVKKKVLSMLPKHARNEIRRHHMFRGGDAG